jgi:hypothetical protein
VALIVDADHVFMGLKRSKEGGEHMIAGGRDEEDV